MVPEDGGKLHVLHQDFVLPTVEAVAELKRELAKGIDVKPAGFPS